MSGPRANLRAIARAVLLELRSSPARLVFFAGCLAVGVGAVTGVAALASAFEAGLRAESRTLLASDLRVSARRPLPPELEGFFADRPHRRADVRELAATATRGDASRLVEVKVVDGGYPFYGVLSVEPADRAPLGDDGVLVAPELAAALELAVGERFTVGGAEFALRGLLLDEPDRLEFQMTLGPRVLMDAAGFARTDLDRALSRVRYAALFAFPSDLDAGALAALADELSDALPDAGYLRVQTHTEAQPNLRRSLGQVEEYLGLVALLSLLLGGIGVSQIVRAWLAGRTRGVAVLRCLGLRAREIAAIYLGNVVLLAAAGALLGALAGTALPFAVRLVAPDLFQGSTATLWQPATIPGGVALGVVVALLFSLPPLTAVWRVPPSSVLRADVAPLPAPRVVLVGAPALLLAGIVVTARLQGGGWLEAGAFAGGLVVLVGVLWLGARAAAGLAERLPRGRLGPTLEHGLAALARPGAGTTGSIVALGLGVTVVLAMWLVESRLGEALRGSLPSDAPSVFLVDVQPEQLEGVAATLVERGARGVESTPVVMARLRTIDGRSATELAAERRDAGEAAWMFTREQRLTFGATLPADNVIVAGALWSDPDRLEVSVEEDFADDLGVGIGSTLGFDVQGVPVELTVTSVRTVEWESFGINFFMVAEPGALDDAPHFRLVVARFDDPADELAAQTALAAAFPNVTLLRVRPLLEKLAAAIGRIALGIRALGSFTILTGIVILVGGVAAAALRRAREAALLKALGVTRAGVARLFAVEYALAGLVAGTVGAAGAWVLAWSFLEHLLELDAELPLWILPVGALATAALASASGLAASAGPLRARPIETLRG